MNHKIAGPVVALIPGNGGTMIKVQLLQNQNQAQVQLVKAVVVAVLTFVGFMASLPCLAGQVSRKPAAIGAPMIIGSEKVTAALSHPTLNVPAKPSVIVENDGVLTQKDIVRVLPSAPSSQMLEVSKMVMDNTLGLARERAVSGASKMGFVGSAVSTVANTASSLVGGLGSGIGIIKLGDSASKSEEQAAEEKHETHHSVSVELLSVTQAKLGYSGLINCEVTYSTEDQAVDVRIVEPLENLADNAQLVVQHNARPISGSSSSHVMMRFDF